jgi:hypothetical protein
MIQPSWRDKWDSIQSKFETCIESVGRVIVQTLNVRIV